MPKVDAILCPLIFNLRLFFFPPPLLLPVENSYVHYYFYITKSVTVSLILLHFSLFIGVEENVSQHA